MEITEAKIIGVEGKDEINFFRALFNYLNIRDIQLIDFGGKDNFNNRIEQIVKLENFNNVSHLGLIRDADNDSEAAFKSVKNSLKKVNLPTPDNNQCFSSKGVPKTGIFIMPGDNKTGMLEDLCIETIDNNTNECIKNLIECVEEKPDKIEKSIIQIYLAVKNPIVNSLGLGALKGHINFDDNRMEAIKEFVLEFNR